MNIVSLKKLGHSLEVDKDYVLKEINKGSFILINLKEKEYPYEVHESAEEMIIAFQGSFVLETEVDSVIIPEGSMVTVPKGVKHRFGDESNALILVAFG